MEIINIVVLCKLSDGTIRGIFTSKEAEVKILDAISSQYPKDEIRVSENHFKGMDIILPEGEKPLSEYYH